MELIAPPNDSDNRSEAVSVGNGGRMSSTGDTVGAGGGGTTFCGECATAVLFTEAGSGFGLGTVADMTGNEINATLKVRKGCSLSD